MRKMGGDSSHIRADQWPRTTSPHSSTFQNDEEDMLGCDGDLKPRAAASAEDLGMIPCMCQLTWGAHWVAMKLLSLVGYRTEPAMKKEKDVSREPRVSCTR